MARPPQVDPESGVAPSSVAYVCERLRAASSGRIGVLGVIVILPVEWLDRPDAPRLAIAYRGDLQAIARIVDVRPPVYVVVTGMESAPGFLEFAHRMSESFRTKRRCGFYLPGEPENTGRLVHGGLVWFSGWYQTWMLHLMATEPVNYSGNSALFTLGTHIRRFRRRLPELLGTAMAAPQGGENIPLHGCYFAATGSSTDTAACAAGIIRGRVLDNTAATRWSVRAIDQDLAYRRSALAVGLIGGSTALLVWAYIALGIGSLGWLGLAMPAPWSRRGSSRCSGFAEAAIAPADRRRCSGPFLTMLQGLDLDNSEIDFSEAERGPIPDHGFLADLNESPVFAFEVLEHEMIVRKPDLGVTATDELIVQKRYVDGARRAILVGSAAAEHGRRRSDDRKPHSRPEIGPEEVEESQWFEVLGHEPLAIGGDPRGHWITGFGVAILQHVIANPGIASHR